MTVGVILAGGQSRRMGGGDKCLLELEGRTLLEHVIGRLQPQTDNIILNANGDPARFARFGIPVVADSFNDYAGPLAGVLAGMDQAAKQGADIIVTVAADTPFFPNDLVRELQNARDGAESALAMAITPDGEGRVNRHPTFGLWPVSLREDLRQALENGTRKVVAWTEPHGTARAVFDNYAADPFFNVNTPDDLEQARRMISEARA